GRQRADDGEPDSPAHFSGHHRLLAGGRSGCPAAQACARPIPRAGPGGSVTFLVLLALGAVPAPQETTPPPVSYAIDATLDERAHRLRGHERIEYRHRVGVPLERLYLQLFPNSFRNAGTTFARQH